jgi:Raf kinase inhibitor-like YbhB/YbcL family protein
MIHSILFFAMAFRLIVPAFPDGAAIPALHTCEGADLSPAIEWSGAPAEAKSFALIVDDPDAPGGVWNHWLLYNIPPTAHSLAQGWKPGANGASTLNDFGKPGYNGPCPPKGHGPHRYYFKLYALDVPALDLAKNAKRSQLDQALKGHVIAETQYMGRYERK